MKLIVGRGLDDVLFGFSEEEVVDALGVPDRAYLSEYDDRRLRYDKLRCSFWFRDDRLHWIRCANQSLTIFGERLYGQRSDAVLTFLKSQLQDPPELEDLDDWESYTFPDSWLEVQFEYDSLKEVCFGHFFSDDDEPVWPVA